MPYTCSSDVRVTGGHSRPTCLHMVGIRTLIILTGVLLSGIPASSQTGEWFQSPLNTSKVSRHSQSLLAVRAQREAVS